MFARKIGRSSQPWGFPSPRAGPPILTARPRLARRSYTSRRPRLLRPFTFFPLARKHSQSCVRCNGPLPVPLCQIHPLLTASLGLRYSTVVIFYIRAFSLALLLSCALKVLPSLCRFVIKTLCTPLGCGWVGKLLKLRSAPNVALPRKRKSLLTLLPKLFYLIFEVTLQFCCLRCCPL